MLATIGIVLSLGGASAAMLAIRRLRGECCPACGTVGTLAPIALALDDLPGGRPAGTQLLRCRDCGTALAKRVEGGSSPALAAFPAR